MPLARDLAASGYAVTGVDLSVVQIERACRLVPTARFVRADATQISFPPSSFDAVVSLYAVIHMPLDEQSSLLGRIATPNALDQLSGSRAAAILRDSN